MPCEDAWGTQSGSDAMFKFTGMHASAAMQHVVLSNVLPRVLDVACGTGSFTLPFLEKCNKEGVSVDLLATDISEGMLDKLKEETTARKLEGKFRMQKMDAQNMDIESSTIDNLICIFGIFLFPDPPKAANEMFRVLKPGGQIVLTFWDKNVMGDVFRLLLGSLGKHPDAARQIDDVAHKYTKDRSKLVSLLGDAGFTDIEITEHTVDFAYENMASMAGMLLKNPVLSKVFSESVDMEEAKKNLVEIVTKPHPDLPENPQNTSLIVTAKKK